MNDVALDVPADATLHVEVQSTHSSFSRVVAILVVEVMTYI